MQTEQITNTRQPIDSSAETSSHAETIPPIEDTTNRRRKWISIWQRIRDFFRNTEVEFESEAKDLLKSEGSPISNFIYRYFYKRQCPYCFHYVTKKVTLEKAVPEKQTKVSMIPFSMPRIKVFICPTCKRELPSDFFENLSSSIAVVGGSGSGKSSYITILCELLINENRTLGAMGISGSIIDAEGRYLFEDYRDKLINKKLALDLTDNFQAPIVLRLHSANHNKALYMTLIDPPGEQFESIDELTKHHAYLRFANGIIFLMNPLDIKGLSKLVYESNSEKLPPINFNRTNNYEVIENLYELFRRGKRVKSNKKIYIPTAFCLSRADLIEDVSSTTLYPDFDPGYTNISEILEEVSASSEDLADLLEETDINLLNIIKTRFCRYTLLPVSPIGNEPGAISAIGQEIHGGVNPKGVIQPIIWILKELKFIKS